MYLRLQRCNILDNLKINNMEIVGIYKNMEVTYREFENALFRLGYQKVSKKTRYFMSMKSMIQSFP